MSNELLFWIVSGFVFAYTVGRIKGKRAGKVEMIWRLQEHLNDGLDAGHALAYERTLIDPASMPAGCRSCSE